MTDMANMAVGGESPIKISQFFKLSVTAIPAPKRYVNQ